MGKVRDVSLFKTLGARGLLAKTVVLKDIKKPLRIGVNAGTKKDGVFKVEFKYECLLQFCLHLWGY